MTKLKNTLKFTLIALVLIVGLLYITDTDYLLKAIRVIYMKGHSTAYLKDFKHFDNQTINASNNPQAWPYHKNYNLALETKRLKRAHTNWSTVAYLIIKNDSIWFEKYYNGYNKNSKSNSFSMAKSYVSGLMQKAIQEGYIKSLNQPVYEFLPDFSKGMAKQMTVGDLSSMASGTNWDEAYSSPLSITTRAYFDDDIAKVIKNLKVVNQPGKAFKYSSGDTQMLAMVIEKATGKKLYQYLEESFWKPLGSVNDVFWQIDSGNNDLVKAFCCIAGNARDFARYGKLIKDFGKWKNQQILDSTFVVKSLKPRFTKSPEYGYGWWLMDHIGKKFKLMRGHLGQYVILQPEDNVIIVRLGKQKSPEDPEGEFTNDIRLYIEEAYKMLENAKI